MHMDFSTPARRLAPPLRSAVPVDVSANDTSMSITTDGWRVRIRGTAGDAGFLPAFASFDVGGKKVMVRLTAGLTPSQLLAELEARLAKRFCIVGSPTRFQIVPA